MTVIVKPNTFTVGNTIVATEHNANFNTIYDDYNGNITNANIKSGAAIANAKLAAPNSYFTLPLTVQGQITSTLDPVFTFQMPFSATLVEVSATIRAITTGGAETYTVDLEEAGTTVLSAPISITASNTPVVGTVSDATIADNAKMEVVLTLGGASPTVDNLTVLCTFKVAHTS
jgi:hypothetical protein